MKNAVLQLRRSFQGSSGNLTQSRREPVNLKAGHQEASRPHCRDGRSWRGEGAQGRAHSFAVLPGAQLECPGEKVRGWPRGSTWGRVQ